ncbi:MAG: adenylate/guanylate cyclase domain-containing protein [Limisphaerales bacterium]
MKASLQRKTFTPMTQAVGFFDLHGSTQQKLKDGNARGADDTHTFLTAARAIVTLFNGTVIKEMGDGVLCAFPDPLDSCKAALNLKAVCREFALLARFGLTVGRVNTFNTLEGGKDVSGDAVDRCARIQSLCSPAQILIDDPLYQTVRSYLREFSDVLTGETFNLEAKGLGQIQLREISLHEAGLVGRLLTSFAVFPEGRMAIAEKVQFARQAERELIEVGTGLTSFAKYFKGQKPSDFRNHIEELLRRGVTVMCYAVDPTYGPARAYLKCTDIKEYRCDLLQARRLILAERKRFLAKGLPTELRYFSYQSIPSFHCICIDGADSMNGRMLISPYIIGLERSECPVYRLSRLSNSQLFQKYWTALVHLQEHSDEIVR